MVRDKSFSHHDSREALQQQGRAVCHLDNRSGRPYLDNLLYELVNDPGVPAQSRDSRGLCERHAYLMLDAGDDLATAILYRAATRKLLDFLSPVPDCPGP
ncbi:MAG TPA: hypothetical protein VE525_15945 [Rubrobacter sp.]|jgi:hypothetical protein|nr:hypothetical protein [Rubrobacter sp.]